MKIEVSAVMPVRNGEKHLEVSMQSIENNQAHLLEILVVDDGSTDMTAKILKSWASRNSKVRVLSTKGIGLINALNLGVEHCHTNYFARFDVDDRYPSDRIALQVAAIDESTVGLFSDYTTFSQDFRCGLGLIPSPIFPSATSISLINGQRSAHPSAVINRHAFIEVGGYRTEDYLVEDLSLWLRLSRLGKLKSVPKVLLDYQISSNSVSGRNRKLMSKHRFDLVNSIGINPSDYNFSARNLDQTVFNYLSTTHGEMRALLHLYDFFTLANQLQDFEADRLVRRILRRKIFSNVLTCSAIISGVAKRRIYRQALNLF